MYILATAGLRLLPSEYKKFLNIKLKFFCVYFSEQNQIIKDLFNDIVRDYDFLVEKTHFQVISGQLEGIYSWIAINYVLGRFQNSNTKSSKFKQIEYKQKKRNNLLFRRSTTNCWYS